MAISSAQLQILKNDIEADPIFSQVPHTEDSAWHVAAAYNMQAAPDFWVWRTAVTVTSLMEGGYDWTRVDNLTVGKARIWQFMTAAGTVNPAAANVRAGFEACFSIDVADQAMRQSIYNQSQRLATRAEKLLALNITGVPSNHHGVGPATMGFEGNVTFRDVLEAWLLP